MWACAAGGFFPKGRAALVFNDVDVGMDKLLEGDRRHALPSPNANFQPQLFFDVGDILEISSHPWFPAAG